MNKVSRKMEADHEEPYEIVCDDPQYLENAIFRCSLQDENCGSFGSKLVKFCRLFFWVFCLPPRPQAITNKLAFAPPKAAYKFVKKGEADGHQPILDILFSLQVKYATMLVINGQEVHQTQGDLRSDVQLPNYAKQKVQGFKILGSESKNAVAVAHITQSEDAPFTILYSHGNSCDFGHTLHFLSVLCTVTRCNLITYDYSGFGESTGSPSEQGMYADHYATYQFLLSKFNLTPDRVILFGHSIGTVAAVELATRVDVAGVILEAPLLSGWKTMNCCRMHESNCVKKHVNPFPSDIRAPKVKAPVLVMHGTDDDIIYMEDGAELCKRFRTAVEPLFIRGAGHNNMCWYVLYYARILVFIYMELLGKSGVEVMALLNKGPAAARSNAPFSQHADRGGVPAAAFQLFEDLRHRRHQGTSGSTTSMSAAVETSLPGSRIFSSPRFYGMPGGVTCMSSSDNDH